MCCLYFLQLLQKNTKIPKFLHLLWLLDKIWCHFWFFIKKTEEALILDADEEEKASLSCKMRISIFISHELSHSWFGNLATMNWWNLLYLNEGFAQFVENFSVDELHKGHNYNSNFHFHFLTYNFHLFTRLECLVESIRLSSGASCLFCWFIREYACFRIVWKRNKHSRWNQFNFWWHFICKGGMCQQVLFF